MYAASDEFEAQSEEDLRLEISPLMEMLEGQEEVRLMVLPIGIPFRGKRYIIFKSL